MNRREALAALVALPAATRISAVPAASDDVIVFECVGHLTPEHVARIRDTAALVWPARKIVVLDMGMRIKVVPA